MHGSSTIHKSPISSPSASSSSSSSTSSLSRSSLSPSLSPAHSIKSKKGHHSKHQRRPSPLKRQMSLGTGALSSPAHAQATAPFDINPLRSHAAGPLAVLYSVEPDEDPLINPHQSPTRSPSKNSPLRGSLHSSPFNDLTATSAVEAPGTPRSVSALAALDRAAPPASPNRSLLSAFQAVSPRLQSITARSSSAPSLSNLNNGSARTASPRGPVPHQQSALAPASPISTSPRQTTHRTSYATAAFRALNGASPQKQIPTKSSSSSSSVASTSAAVNVSPVRSRSSSALRQEQNDGPTWQIYRDADAHGQSTSSSSTASAVNQLMNPQNNEKGVFALDEDIEDDQNLCENDENSIPSPQPESAAPRHTRTSSHTTLDMHENTRTASGPAHRRSSLSMSSLPRDMLRERDVTPPPSTSRWIGAVQDGMPPDGHGSIADVAAATGSATRARKRLRTSGEMALSSGMPDLPMMCRRYVQLETTL